MSLTMSDAKVRVFHDFYGCETGCCGHRIVSDELKMDVFLFEHPYNRSTDEFIKEIVNRVTGHDLELDFQNVSHDCQNWGDRGEEWSSKE